METKTKDESWGRHENNSMVPEKYTLLVFQNIRKSISRQRREKKNNKKACNF